MVVKNLTVFTIAISRFNNGYTKYYRCRNAGFPLQVNSLACEGVDIGLNAWVWSFLLGLRRNTCKHQQS